MRSRRVVVAVLVLVLLGVLAPLTVLRSQSGRTATAIWNAIYDAENNRLRTSPGAAVAQGIERTITAIMNLLVPAGQDYINIAGAMRLVAVAPLTCVVGQDVYTNTVTGQAYFCSATDFWSPIGGSIPGTLGTGIRLGANDISTLRYGVTTTSSNMTLGQHLVVRVTTGNTAKLITLPDPADPLTPGLYYVLIDDNTVSGSIAMVPSAGATINGVAATTAAITGQRSHFMILRAGPTAWDVFAMAPVAMGDVFTTTNNVFGAFTNDFSAGTVILPTGGVGATALASTAVTPATYGTAIAVPQVIVDADGRVTSAVNVPITGIAGSHGILMGSLYTATAGSTNTSSSGSGTWVAHNLTYTLPSTQRITTGTVLDVCATWRIVTGSAAPTFKHRLVVNSTVVWEAVAAFALANNIAGHSARECFQILGTEVPDVSGDVWVSIAGGISDSQYVGLSSIIGDPVTINTSSTVALSLESFWTTAGTGTNSMQLTGLNIKGAGFAQ